MYVHPIIVSSNLCVSVTERYGFIGHVWIEPFRDFLVIDSIIQDGFQGIADLQYSVTTKSIRIFCLNDN